MKAPNRGLLVITPTTAAFNVNGDIGDHARFGDFEVPRLRIVDKHQTGARCALAVEQPDVRGDVKPTAQGLD